jgi:uncharacterized protein with NRDE domain
MCLLVIAWRIHPRYRLVLAANRDEFHDRPARPLGVVTNYRELARRRRSAPSRGGLIPAFLGSSATPRSFLDSIELDATSYAGFNLLLADGDSLWYASNRADRFARPLEPGIYGLSNHSLDTPWPKLVKVRERFASLLAREEVDAASLLTLLADREPAVSDAPADTGLPADWERALSSPFVNHENYGTRCSTVVTVRPDGNSRVLERRFDHTGEQRGDTVIDL